MLPNRTAKCIRVGNSLAFILPAQLCRDLHITRDTFLSIQVASPDSLVLTRAKVVAADSSGEEKDPALLTIQHGTDSTEN